MGKGRGLLRVPPPKRPNLDHFAHQLHVTGVGPHRNKKKEQELLRKAKHKKNLKEENK